mmetsp:Transcript_15580/g.38428  ORF Transcript_15580/g.38428 Transcript_15580/m.38428 type:complete len:347 (+) Transcript_15580:24-1064(+)
MMLRQQLLKYQYQQRLLFSTARRRRKKPKLPSTTKDRLRRRTGVLPHHPGTQKEMKIDSDLVTERMQTRLDWVRSNVESLWKDPNATNRPDRYEIAMDGNWWKWNILLALTPGILIAAYCELVAKPMMLEQNRKDGSNGLPQPTSSSFLEDLYGGLMHYLYGMEPVDAGTKQIQSETADKSPQETDLQQLQALKDQIRDLEDRMTSPSQRPRPGIHQRHKMPGTPKSEESSDSSSTGGESSIPSAAAGWVLQTLTESLGFIQEAANTVLFPSPPETKGIDNDASKNAITGDTDSQDEQQSSSSQAEASSSSSSLVVRKEEEEDGIITTNDESTDKSSRRRWWQVWK